MFNKEKWTVADAEDTLLVAYKEVHIGLEVH